MKKYYYENPADNPYTKGTEEAAEWDDNNTVTLESLVDYVSELAFGDDAYNREYFISESLDTLMEFSTKALAFDQMGLVIINPELPEGKIH